MTPRLHVTTYYVSGSGGVSIETDVLEFDGEPQMRRAAEAFRDASGEGRNVYYAVVELPA